MALWGEDDTLGRWIQGVCALGLALFAIGDAYFVLSNFGLLYGITGFTLFLGALRLCWQCARYALTGRGNVNREGY